MMDNKMTMPALVSLAGFLKEIEDPKFKAEEWSSLDRFVEAAYDYKWVRPGFDWPTWAQSSQAAQLRDDPDSIANAEELDLVRLLTVCIRQDKFSEGALIAAFDSGLIRRIVRRAAMILDESTAASVTPATSYRTYVATSRAAYIAGIEAGISPQELRAHTGVIGEAFVADHLGVKLTSTNNQPGYDMIDQDGLRVSVKTITTSTHVTLNAGSMHQVDRIVVVWLGTKADELDVVIVYDKSTDEFIADAAIYRGRRRLTRGAMSFPDKPVIAETFSVGDIVDTHNEGNVLFRRHASGSFTVLAGR